MIATGVFTAGCGAGRVDGTAGEVIEQLPADFMPSEIRGLPVTREDMSDSIAGVEDAFVESVGLYAMRRDELVQATLQVSLFRENAPLHTARFRTSLVSQIGGAKAQAFRMSEDTVYRTTGRKQVISLWFRDQYMFVLSVRDTYEEPRGLLRAALEIEPE